MDVPDPGHRADRVLHLHGRQPARFPGQPDVQGPTSRSVCGRSSSAAAASSPSTRAGPRPPRSRRTTSSSNPVPTPISCSRSVTFYLPRAWRSPAASPPSPTASITIRAIAARYSPERVAARPGSPRRHPPAGATVSALPRAPGRAASASAPGVRDPRELARLRRQRPDGSPRRRGWHALPAPGPTGRSESRSAEGRALRVRPLQDGRARNPRDRRPVPVRVMAEEIGEAAQGDARCAASSRSSAIPCSLRQRRASRPPRWTSSTSGVPRHLSEQDDAPRGPDRALDRQIERESTDFLFETSVRDFARWSPTVFDPTPISATLGGSSSSSAPHRGRALGSR